ncbi:MAG: TetR family transcriptional regulator, partial [Deltaproteobacteria bacterium]|nr:TetR family transcriptional regulator [Deltaproteobacteria bacterium]
MIEPEPSARSRRPTHKPNVVRSRILEVGTRLIAERGVDGVNSNVIARAARVGVG